MEYSNIYGAYNILVWFARKYPELYINDDTKETVLHYAAAQVSGSHEEGSTSAFIPDSIANVCHKMFIVRESPRLSESSLTPAASVWTPGTRATRPLCTTPPSTAPTRCSSSSWRTKQISTPWTQWARLPCTLPSGLNWIFFSDPNLKAQDKIEIISARWGSESIVKFILRNKGSDAVRILDSGDR